MRLDVHPTRLAICRLDPDQPEPAWVADADGPLVSITRTGDELSIVVAASAVPESVKAERDWRALSVRGPLSFELTGVLAGLSGALAEAEIPIFVVSTYDTDWLLVREGDLARSIDVLRSAGHDVRDAASA